MGLGSKGRERGRRMSKMLRSPFGHQLTIDLCVMSHIDGQFRVEKNCLERSITVLSIPEMVQPRLDVIPAANELGLASLTAFVGFRNSSLERFNNDHGRLIIIRADAD